jgi:predicted outer membrane repeat protein
VQFVALGGVNGGAVSVEAGGQLAVIESVFARNVASGLGGAISMNSSASNTLTVEGTLFDSNVGGTEGGAINQVAGTLAVTNSTFFGNSLTSTATSAKGGAINVGGLANPSNATLKYLTMAKNSAGPSGSANGRGGAINIANAATGVLTLATSLVVDNAAATGANIADMGEITNGGYNIVGFNGISGMVSTAGNTLYNFTSGTSTTATTVSVADVVETALAENGGVTASLRLPAESYARNRIPNLHTECSSATAVGSDQRGKARPDDSEEDCDVGAYEREQSSDCSDNNKEEGYSIGFYPGSNTVCFGSGSIVAGSAVHPFYLLLLVMVGLFGARQRIARLRR